MKSGESLCGVVTFAVEITSGNGNDLCLAEKGCTFISPSDVSVCIDEGRFLAIFDVLNLGEDASWLIPVPLDADRLDSCAHEMGLPVAIESIPFEKPGLCQPPEMYVRELWEIGSPHLRSKLVNRRGRAWENGKNKKYSRRKIYSQRGGCVRYPCEVSV